MNVGYSPTFDGEENKEKIVEAHLIIDEGDIEGDFYGETMRLSLSGFLRPGALHVSNSSMFHHSLKFSPLLCTPLVCWCCLPEMKFPSFPDLIKAITNDVQTAKESLDLEPYTTFSEDPFLTDCDSGWTGKSGGDEAASFEFESTVWFLSEE